MPAGEKFRVDNLKFDYSKKRAFAGMSSIETADVTLRVPYVLAELAEEDFLVWGCLFHFRCFSKINMIYSSILLCFVLEQFQLRSE